MNFKKLPQQIQIKHPQTSAESCRSDTFTLAISGTFIYLQKP